jgi:ribosomal protein L21E
MNLSKLLPYLNQESKDNLDMMNKMGIKLGQVVSDPRVKVFGKVNEAEDDKYTHIGYGKYKLKGKEDDENSPTFTKDDTGKYIPTKSDKGGKGQEKPKVNIFDKPKSDGMDTVKSIAAKTGLRAQALAGWADENGVNLSKVSDAINSKKLKPMDLMTAISGNPGNKYAKDIIAKYSQSNDTKSDTTKVPSSKLTDVLPKANPETFEKPSDINKIPDSQKLEVSMKIDKLAELAKQAKEKGEAAPNFNLCEITIPGTNLYCEGNAGIPREQMPQFKGTPTPGSPADKLPRDNSGEVDTEPMFRAMLKKNGIKTVETELPSDRLKATQSELVGAKVAGMTKALEKDPNHPAITAPIYVSRDGYVVDGHHRWAAMTSYAMKSGKPANMRVIVIDKDINEVIPMSNKFAEDIGVAAKKAQTQKEIKKAFKEIIELTRSYVNEQEEGQVNVGGYETQHFDVCPAATALYKDIESKGVDMDLASRTAKLQDVLFFIEKHVQEQGYKPNPYYGKVAQILGDQIMTMGGMMDLGSEHSYIQGHIDKIQSAVENNSIKEASEKTIVNPETGKRIKVSTALSYDKKHPAYKAASKLSSKSAPKKSSYERGDTVRIISNPKFVTDKNFWGKAGYVKNTMGRDVMVTFPNGRTIIVDPRDLQPIANESVNEAAKPSQVRSVISRVKKDLMKKWKQKGGYENFGDKEGDMLRKKFNFNPYGSSEEREIAQMIQGFEEWAINYDGNMRETVNEAKAISGGKIHKFITGKNLIYKGKKYPDIEFELLGIDNSNQLVNLKVLFPKNIFGQEMKVPFKSIRRGGFIKTDTSKVNESSNYEVYHKSYTSAIDTALEYAKKKGFTTDPEEVADLVGLQSRRPGKGKTTRVSIPLYKNGKPQRAGLQIVVYGMDGNSSRPYELTTYIR